MAVVASRARSVKDSAIVRPCTVIRRSISSRRPLIVSVRLPTSREMRSATSLPRLMTSSKAVRRAPRVSSISRVRLSTVVDRVSAVRLSTSLTREPWRGDRQHDVLAGAGETGLRIVRVTGEGVREFLAAGFEGGAGSPRPGAPMSDERRSPAWVRLRLEGLALDGDGFADAPACRFEAGGEILDAGADGLVGQADRALQLLAHFAAALADLAGDVGGRRRQALAEFVAAQNDLVDDPVPVVASCSRRVVPRVDSSLRRVPAVRANSSRRLLPLVASS